MCNKLKCPLCGSEDIEAYIESGFELGALFKFICHSCSVNFIQNTSLTCVYGYCAMFLNHGDKLDISKVVSEEQYSLLVQLLKNQKGLGVVVDTSPEEYYKLKKYGNKI
jgi:hypothetical protein